NYETEKPFIEECYPNGGQKPGLSEKEKEMLLAIFKDNSYKSFLSGLLMERRGSVDGQESGEVG
ncbi:MAG: hypothetical protein HZB33_01625, partial [Nitrospirae bacterium]|nr:hypothetical protein [Nitrospirota bacterium]